MFGDAKIADMCYMNCRHIIFDERGKCILDDIRIRWAKKLPPQKLVKLSCLSAGKDGESEDHPD
jgi:hypothetical protein